MPATQTTQPKGKISSHQLSALEIATMGKKRALGGQTPVKLEMDAADEDWKPLVLLAKQNGPRSWFASKVDFNLNSARFVGRVGYPVQGGVIPLFDGAAMDVRDAEMTARKPKEAEADPRMDAPSSYKNWVIGSGGLLVLAPANADNVIPVRMEKMIVTEKKVVASANKHVEFYKENAKISAKEIVLNDQEITLNEIAVKHGEIDKSKDYRETAAINQEGISLFPAPVSMEDIPGAQRDFLEKTGNLWQRLSEEPVSEISKGKDFDLASNTEEEKPLWIVIKDALKDETIENLKDAMDALIKGDVNVAKGIFEEKWEQLKAVYDGFEDKELQESWQNMPDVLRNIFVGNITDEQEIQNYMTRLFPQDQLVEFLGMDKGEDEAKDKKDSGSDATIPLAAIMLFPGVNFEVDLIPSYSFSAYVRGSADNLPALWNTGADGYTNIKLSAGIQGTLSLRATAGLAVGIPALFEGVLRLYAEAGLKGSVLEENAENTMLKAQVDFPVRRNAKGSFEQAGELKGSLEGGLQLYGTVGMEGAVRSRILLWEKKLMEKKFGYWTLGEIHALLEVSKKPGGGILSGWSLDTASLAIKGPDEGFGAAFQKNNTPEKKYGLYDPEIKESIGYDQIHNDFIQALDMLEEYLGSRADGSYPIISTREGEGTNQILDEMKEIRSRFILLWADGLREQQVVLLNLEALENSKKFQKETEESTKSADKHTVRHAKVAHLLQYTADNAAAGETPADAATGEALYQQYAKSTKHKDGGGYKKRMEKEAREKSTSFSSIVRYERDEYQRIINLHKDIMEQVLKWEGERKSNTEIFSLYKALTNSDIENHRAMLQNTSAIIDYEQQEILKEQQKKSSPDAKYKKITQMSDTYKDQQAFVLACLKDIPNVKAMDYGTAELLVEFEKNRLGGEEGKLMAEEADSIQKRIQEINEGRLTSENAEKEFLAEKGKASFSELLSDDDLFRTASVDDLIEVELGSSYLALRNYLAEEAQKPQAEQSLMAAKEKREQIFGKEKTEEAERQFREYVNSLALKDLIPNMTMDIVKSYMGSGSFYGDKKEEAYINASYVKVKELLKAKKPEEARQAELEAIQQYFTIFSSARMEQYAKKAIVPPEKSFFRTASAEETPVNLSFMMEALESGAGKSEEEQQRLEMLRAAKEKNIPAYQVVQQYLDMKGSKKLVTAHQKEKASQGLLHLDDIFRYEQSKLIKETSGKFNKTSYYERYFRLKTMMENQVPYEEMLKAYKDMGGGKNYEKALKEKIKAGKLEGMTREKVMAVEAAKRDKNNTAVNRRNARIDLVVQMDKEGKDYQEILEAYEQQARTDGDSLIGKGKAMLNESGLAVTKTGFEKSLKDRNSSFTAGDILHYEQILVKKESEEHAVRLRALLGLPMTAPPKEFLNVPLPADEAVMLQRREAYLRKNPLFEESEQVKTDMGKELGSLFNRPVKEQAESILAYEKERKDYYWGQYLELMEKKQRLMEMNAHLQSMQGFISSFVYNFDEIRAEPERILDKIKQFREEAEKIKRNTEIEEAYSEERREIGTAFSGELEQMHKKEEAQ